MTATVSLSLFPDDAEAAPYVRHSPTSRDSAIKITPHLNKLQADVFALFEEAGEDGMTDNQLIALWLARYPERSPNTPRPRRIELTAMGLIVDTGRRVTVKGRESTVWKAVKR